MNSTRLKERIILAYPGISAHSQGCEVLLTLDSAIAEAIRDACEQDDVDADGMCSAKANNNDLKGPVSKQSESEDRPIQNQASRSISQLIIYNTTLRKSKSSATSIHHNREREISLPIYVGLKIHGLTELPSPVIQHPTTNNHGVKREQNVIDRSSQQERKVPSLPTEFANVKPVVMADEAVFAPPIVGTIIKTDYDDNEFYTKETEKWEENASVLCEKDIITADENISWTAFHASEEPPTQFEPAITSLTPMFLESGHSVPMVLPGMNIVNDAIQLVSPGQVSVIAMDQPLFELAKTIQWKWPLTHREDKFVILLIFNCMWKL